MKHFLTHSMVLFIILTASAPAQEVENTPQLGTSDDILATMGEVSLTQKEVDAALSRIPADKRLMFVRDGEKVEQLVRNMLRNKALAKEAVKVNYDQEPLVKLRLEQDRESSLAREWLDKVVADAPEVDYAALAEEEYLLNPEAWKTEDAIDVSHILISNETRSDGEARDLAAYVWQLLDQDPSRFDELVEEYSDDPSKASNGGRFENVRKNDMVPNFEKVAFALEQPGDFSAPTETPYGYHIIRLNKKMPGEIPPFESVKKQAIKQARADYVDEYRKKYLRQLLAENIVLQDGAAEDLAKRYFGENLELSPDFSED
jgi:parvulin-like peptidyl-prolyl isomerase